MLQILRYILPIDYS